LNLLVLLPFVLLGFPFIITILEIFRRKDRGPREVLEQTTYEEKPDIDTPLFERAREEARVKVTGEVLRITGDISIPDGTKMNNHLVVQGNFKSGRNIHVYGSIKVYGNVELGEGSIIEGHLLSEGSVLIKRNCVVKGIVDSVKDIILEENVVVEAVSTEKTVKVGPNAKINRRVYAGSQIVASTQKLQAEDAEKHREAPAPSTAGSASVGLLPQKSSGSLESPEKIFSYLEECLRKLDEDNTHLMEYKLEDLSPLEAKVFNATITCRTIEEVCLKLFKSVPEVESILEGLVKKGFLDENFKPKKQFIKKIAEPKFSETVSWQPAPKPIASEDERQTQRQPSEKMLTERPVASRPIEELKKRLQIIEEKNSKPKQPTSLLDEWHSLSKAIWIRNKMEENVDFRRAGESPEKKIFTAEDELKELEEL